MSDLLTRAELIKLSRVLTTDEKSVAFLAPLGPESIRLLQERVSAALFDEHRGALQRLADASRLLPASLVAKMSELVFGPMLSARVAGLMPPARAVEVSTKLHMKFLADVTVQLDPRSASDLLALIPAKTIVEVARVLLERREYVTMGRFVDDLPEQAIRAVMQDLSDEALLRIGFFVERRARLAELIDLVAPERLRGVVKAVSVGSAEVQSAGLAMISQLPPRHQGRLGDIAVTLGAAALTGLIATAQRENASEVVAAVMVNVSADGRKAFAALLEDMDARTLASWADATTQARLWPAALRILADSGPDIQKKAASALSRLDKGVLKTVAAVADREKLRAGLGPVKDLLP